MSENLAEQFAVLPENLSNHLKITVIGLMLGMLISFPLAILIVRVRCLRYPAMTAVSMIQTIPSLALLALMVPLLIGLSALTSRLLGLEFSALGFYPAVIGLTLYSILPILRNTVTGILGVDPAMTEAARGVGMTPRQMLWRVEIPLALPVIIAGLRTATVWVVGIATLATPVGQRCLGNYIFRGLQTFNWTAVIFGCIVAAILAIGLDLLIGGIETAARERRRRLGILSLAALAAIFISGLVAPTGVAWVRAGSAAPWASDTSGKERIADRIAPRTVWIGSKTFTEQYILASLISHVLVDAGFDVRERESLGSTVIFDALASGEIDLYIDYSGTIWANSMRRDDVPAAWQVLAEMTAWLATSHGIRCLGPLGFENAYALAMRREMAEELAISSIGDLAPHSPSLRIGGDYEFFGRPEWRAMREIYSLRFADQISYDSTFMYSAVASGDVDVISAFSSDGRIAALDLVTLQDPRQSIPPYDAVLLVSQEAADWPDLIDALAPLIGSISIDDMRRANHMVDRPTNRKTVSDAARWLREQTQQTHR